MDVSSITQSLNSDYISKITDAMKSSASATTSAATSATDSTGTFDSIYDSALGMINETNGYIQDAQKAETDFALGNLTNTHELSVLQQKANLSLQYTVAIRDKVLDAYKEIMNMNI